jgi:hypothetical protein
VALGIIPYPIGQLADPERFLSHESRTFVKTAVIAHHQIVLEFDHAVESDNYSAVVVS